jgi:AraC-like DNA-binding protein
MELSLKVQSCGAVVCPADWRVETDEFQFHRLYHVRGGSADYRDASGSTRLLPGCLYLLPRGRSYALRHDPADPLVCLWLHVVTAPAILDDLVVVRVDESPALGHCLAALDGLVGLHASGEDCFDQLVDLARVIFFLFDRSQHFATSGDERVARTIRHVQTAYADDCSLARLAGIANVSAWYLVRLFRRTLGTTPHHYVMETRLAAATRLLAQHQPVERTAEHCGFSDPKVFSRAFRRRYGASPAAFAGRGLVP